MPDVEMFDSFDQMMDTIAARRDAANQVVHEQQRTITYGSYAVLADDDLLVFGRVWTEQESEDSERSAGAEPDELAETLASLRASHENGYRFGRWYSIAEPDGELGDNHLLNLWPITEELFEVMRTAGWNHDNIPAEHVRPLAVAVNSLILHKRANGYR